MYELVVHSFYISDIETEKPISAFATLPKNIFVYATRESEAPYLALFERAWLPMWD
jgi:hypothetical protein